MIARTPEPPYWAVIFSSIRTEGDNGYGAMAEAMERLAAQQPGYLGFESARDKALGPAHGRMGTPPQPRSESRPS